MHVSCVKNTMLILRFLIEDRGRFMWVQVSGTPCPHVLSHAENVIGRFQKLPQEYYFLHKISQCFVLIHSSSHSVHPLQSVSFSNFLVRLLIFFCPIIAFVVLPGNLAIICSSGSLLGALGTHVCLFLRV